MTGKTGSEAKSNDVALIGVPAMSDREFSLFSELIYSVTGIKMPPEKKLMLISRLNKRIRILGLKSFKEYYEYITSREGMAGEYHRMIDAVTTNKTDFFREPEHFSILQNRIFPELVKTERFTRGNPINIWSAGCSTGEEPYTIAMVAADFFKNRYGAVSILATDLSTKVLNIALNAVYSETAISPIPLAMRKKYILRGKGERTGDFRVAPEVRKMVNFRKLNLMDDRFTLDMEMDIVFCRNVIIYFDRPTQAELFEKFHDVISPGGYLFIGSSETLHGLSDRFVSIGPTVYRKR